jgi:hypothetical protein
VTDAEQEAGTERDSDCVGDPETVTCGSGVIVGVLSFINKRGEKYVDVRERVPTCCSFAINLSTRDLSREE